MAKTVNIKFQENVKELIRFCMTRHEAEIQKLAQTPLGSQRFDLFIRRWDMNNAPPPEETTPDKYVITYVVAKKPCSSFS